MRNCSGKAGFVYNVDTQNLITFEENLKLKRDMPLTAYIDFETTAPTDDYLDPECNKMNVVSYVIILAFHPKLNLPRVIIERSFAHSLDRLCQIDYLTSEQLQYKDMITLKQLKDCAFEVDKKNNPVAVSEMFNTEIRFATNCLLAWFSDKYKKLELNIDFKKQYESENPIDWENGRCVLCTFPLDANPTMLKNQNVFKKHLFKSAVM